MSTACSIPALASSASAVFAVPECTLDQGPGKMSIARIVAREWQTDGHIKPGKIERVRRLTTEEFLSDMFGFESSGSSSRSGRRRAR